MSKAKTMGKGMKRVVEKVQVTCNGGGHCKQDKPVVNPALTDIHDILNDAVGKRELSKIITCEARKLPQSDAVAVIILTDKTARMHVFTKKQAKKK